MAGTLRSKRCQRCRRRKIKCDEKWPSCTPCSRAKSPCSGPPVGDRFPDRDSRSSSSSTGQEVNNLVAVRPPPSSSNRSNGSPRSTTTGSVRDSDLNGLSSSTRRLANGPISSPSPRTDPTTTAERVAARLIAYLDKGTSTFDASLAACYLRLLPSRLGDSPALRDAVALFCCCWGNFRRGVPPERLIDPKAYGKALRSLQGALNDPRHQLKDETLAATSILNRAEVMFDVRRQFGRVTHARGIVSLMARRGPPKPDNELDLYLTLENHDTLLYSSQFDGAPNLFLTTQWRAGIRKVLDNGTTDLPRLLVEGYQLDQMIGCWPQIFLDLQNLKEPVYPVQELSTDAGRLDKAFSMRGQIETFFSTVHSRYTMYKTEVIQAGQITEWPDPTSIIGTRYDFCDVGVAQMYIMYLTVLITFNRILHELSLIIGVPSMTLDAENRVLSREVWMCLKYFQGIGPIAAILFSWVMTLAMEAGNDMERRCVLETMLDLDKYKQRLPKNMEELEEIVMSVGRVHMGRATMGDLQRFSLRV